jgi:3D (Asp-Asp-Asp) domain-containing protein
MTNAIITAYCACQVCCGPDAQGLTASGRAPVQGRTVAANGVRFGTRLYIAGLGWRVVEDRLHPRYTGRVDVYFARHEDAARFGKRRMKVRMQ